MVDEHPLNEKLVERFRAAIAAPARRPLPTVCRHLDPTPVWVAGSVRTWRRCTAGYGSTAKGAEGLVCGCGTPGPGVWCQGVECGPNCRGYPTATRSPDTPDGGVG